MVIIPPGQEILVEIDDAKFWITPLTAGQRAEIMHFKKNKAGELEVDTEKLALLSLKYGVKKIEGIKNLDGSNFKFDFTDNGRLSDKHCNILIQSSILVQSMALKMAQGNLQPSVGVTIKQVPSKKKPRSRT